MLIPLLLTGCTGTESDPPGEPGDSDDLAVACGDDLAPDYLAEHSCERLEDMIPWLQHVDVDGKPCKPVASGAYAFCQHTEPLETKCEELYDGPCPSFVELLARSGWIDGEPQYVGMDAYARFSVAGPDYDVIFYYLEDPPPTMRISYGLLHFFHPATGELMAIELMNYGTGGGEQWCCQDLAVPILTWGEWSHLPDDETEGYEHEDFQP